MTAEEIVKALESHKKWMQGKEDGVKLNWRGKDLGNADLGGANLCYADLGNANLRNADLRYANLGNADLGNADLRNADLGNANLRNADLGNADLRYANLGNADLRYANLGNADLGGADLGNADLRYANLGNADLGGADLRYADLRNAKNLTYIPMCLPEGEFIAYKKIKDCQDNKYIVKLRILAISKRSRATGDKCRCDMAKVEEIQDMDGNKLDIAEVEHCGYKQITYKVGELVKADGWNENRFEECTNGIHFFVDRQSAVNYNL